MSSAGSLIYISCPTSFSRVRPPSVSILWQIRGFQHELLRVANSQLKLKLLFRPRLCDIIQTNDANPSDPQLLAALVGGTEFALYLRVCPYCHKSEHICLNACNQYMSLNQTGSQTGSKAVNCPMAAVEHFWRIKFLHKDLNSRCKSNSNLT